MKIRFDSKALFFFIIMLVVVFLLSIVFNLIQEYEVSPKSLFPFIIFILIFYGIYKMFQIPICLKMGWYKKGEILIKKAIEKFGESPAVSTLYFNLFYFSFQLGKFKEAEDIIRKINFSDLPQELVPIVEMNKAILNMANDKFQAALDILRRYNIEDFNPKSGPVFLNNLAFAYYGLGINLEEGIDMVDRAFNMSPDPRFSGTLASLLYKTYQMDAALAWADYGIKRIKKKERYARSWIFYIKSLILKSMGIKKDAIECAQYGLKICFAEPLSNKYKELIKELKKSKK